jgi:hypothetical protein
MTDAHTSADRAPERYVEPVVSATAVVVKMNPWMIGLSVIWVILAIAGVVLLVLASNAADATFDNATGPRHDVLAGIYYSSAGVIFAVALITIVAQIAVRAVRWQARD